MFQAVTYFTNPSFPETDSSPFACLLRIAPPTSVCYVQLDYEVCLLYNSSFLVSFACNIIYVFPFWLHVCTPIVWSLQRWAMQVLDVPSVNGKCAYDSISLLRWVPFTIIIKICNIKYWIAWRLCWLYTNKYWIWWSQTVTIITIVILFILRY